MMHPVAQTNPLQKVCDVLLVFLLPFATDPERERNILPGCEMVEQSEVLEYDADPSPQAGAFGRIDIADFLVEQFDVSTRWLKGQKHQSQQGCLSRA